ncbi:DUF4132 domain-containing protein [Haloferula chungangensis]|uniref:DUF4132 domain-containing protein n=1 Tax=Haloferula chungangensis TaxID=1048331 RepID=A0ABW2L562_9BACT
MRNIQWLKGLSDEARKLIEAYVEDGGGDVPRLATQWIAGYEIESFSKLLAKEPELDGEGRICLKMLFGLSAHNSDYRWVSNFIGHHDELLISLADELIDASAIPGFARSLGSYQIKWVLRETPSDDEPFESVAANYLWRNHDFSQTVWMTRDEALALALARYRPDKFGTWIADPSIGADAGASAGWLAVAEETESFDQAMIDTLLVWIAEGAEIPPHHEKSNAAVRAFEFLCKLNKLRGGSFKELLMKWVRKPLFIATREGVELLVEEAPDEVCGLVFHAKNSGYGRGTRGLYRLALQDLDGMGSKLLEKEIAASYLSMAGDLALEVMLTETPAGKEEVIRRMIRIGGEGRHATKSRSQSGAPDYWEEVAKHDSLLMAPEMRELLCGKSRALREIAADWLVRMQADECAELAGRLGGSKGIPDRIGAAFLLGRLGTPEAIRRLVEMHAVEPSKTVRTEIGQLASTRGISVEKEPERVVESVGSIGEFEKGLLKKAKSIRMPKAPWLNVEALPGLVSVSGETLSELAVTYLFQLQARQKGGELAPELEPVLSHLDRGKNAVFAHALLDQWFASDMKAPTRWALNVAAMLGDDSIIDRLIRPIPEWCGQNHGSRAEWCAHAIALLGSEGAMQTLDALIQRYRNHRKYVSAAASDAIRTLAEIQGISEDEMAERIVPDFGFNAEGERQFTAKSGEKVTARLRADLKLVWQVGDGKEAGTIPKNLTSSDSDAAKDLKKFLTQALKSQTLRLERTMIEGRRWELKVWRERFEAHPVFRCYAESLVWGVYDQQGSLKRTFRRYANGILADASGEPEELEDEEMMIGLVHPLMLDDSLKSSWRAHLRRFKVKPAFGQIDRAIELLDPLHGNRRELRLAEGCQIDASVFRNRAMGRGWSIGSTQDGGYIYDCFRKFPGLCVEVYLALEDFHATSGRGDEIKLGIALFAKPDANQKRAYLGVMPGVDDERVLRFGEVPAVVYSETVADLKAIMGEVKA